MDTRFWRRAFRWAAPAALLLLTGPHAARLAAATPAPDWPAAFTATDDFLFDPSLPLDQLLAAIDCIRGEPTDNPLQPCSPGSRLRIRGVLSQSAITSSDPRFSGLETVTVNANLNQDYAGQAWGRWSLVVGDGEGVWEGSWLGRRVRTPGGGPTGGDAWTTRITLIGFGTGSLDGLRVLAQETIVTYTPLPLPYEALGICPPGSCPPEGTISGRIFALPRGRS